MPARPRRRLGLVLALALAAVGAAACGGGGAETAPSAQANDPSRVPEGAIAVVAGTEVPRADFDRFFRQAEAAFEAQGREFPATGTPEYEQLKNQAVDLLVQRVQFALEAEALGIAVTDAEVQERLDELRQQFFEGDDEEYRQELERQGVTEEDVREDLRAQIMNERIFEEVTKDVTVTAEEVRAYYEENQERFTTAESREVAHILVETEAEAQRIYEQLEDGADFAELAREESTDEGTAENGGQLTANRGELVAPFEDAAFALETGAVSEPVETQFGWHVIQALTDVVPAAVTPFVEVEESIESQLLQEKRNEVMTAWVEQVRARYLGQVFYAVGFEPLASVVEPTDTGSEPPAEP